MQRNCSPLTAGVGFSWATFTGPKQVGSPVAGAAGYVRQHRTKAAYGEGTPHPQSRTPGPCPSASERLRQVYY